MKTLKNFALVSLLLATCIPAKTKASSVPFLDNVVTGAIEVVKHRPSGAFTFTALTTPITLPLLIFTSIFSAIKIIRTFCSRHDYARNFISSPKKIATYCITTQAIHKNRNTLRSKIIARKTFEGKDFYMLIKECCEWVSLLEEKVLIVAHPSIALLSGKSYNLKRLTFEAIEHECLGEELIDVFYIPPHNSYTYGKKMAVWSIPLGGSFYLLHVIFKTLQLG